MKKIPNGLFVLLGAGVITLEFLSEYNGMLGCALTSSGLILMIIGLTRSRCLLKSLGEMFLEFLG